MSWHDNHVHAVRIVEGEHGSGELLLDIDYIEEWIRGPGGRIQFKIQPSTLSFHKVTNLRLALDYKAACAALGPFSIHAIHRVTEQRERYVAVLWTIEINWPEGEITFEAEGFTQTGRGDPVLSEGQHLSAGERPA